MFHLVANQPYYRWTPDQRRRILEGFEHKDNINTPQDVPQKQEEDPKNPQDIPHQQGTQSTTPRGTQTTGNNHIYPDKEHKPKKTHTPIQI